MSRVTSASERQQLQDFAVAAARLLADRHCEAITLLDVSGISQVCDFILIANGTSDRQMKSVADELMALGEEHGHACFRNNRDSGVTWLVLDFVDLVIHLFEPSQRTYYALEDLWSDGRPVSWER